MCQIVSNTLCNEIKRIPFDRYGALYDTFVCSVKRFVIYTKIVLYRLIISKAFMRRSKYCYILYFPHFKLFVFILFAFIIVFTLYFLVCANVLFTRGSISLQSCITTSLSLAKATKAGTTSFDTLISFSFSMSFISLPDLNRLHQVFTAPVNVFSLYLSYTLPIPLGLIMAPGTPCLLMLLSFRSKYTTCFIVQQIFCNKNSTIICNKSNQM